MFFSSMYWRRYVHTAEESRSVAVRPLLAPRDARDDMLDHAVSRRRVSVCRQGLTALLGVGEVYACSSFPFSCVRAVQKECGVPYGSSDGQRNRIFRVVHTWGRFCGGSGREEGGGLHTMCMYSHVSGLTSS